MGSLSIIWRIVGDHLRPQGSPPVVTGPEPCFPEAWALALAGLAAGKERRTDCARELPSEHG